MDGLWLLLGQIKLSPWSKIRCYGRISCRNSSLIYSRSESSSHFIFRRKIMFLMIVSNPFTGMNCDYSLLSLTGARLCPCQSSARPHAPLHSYHGSACIYFQIKNEAAYLPLLDSSRRFLQSVVNERLPKNYTLYPGTFPEFEYY